MRGREIGHVFLMCSVLLRLHYGLCNVKTIESRCHSCSFCTNPTCASNLVDINHFQLSS